MSKKYHCAKCGLKLEVIQKAIPYQGRVMNLVKPHTCLEENTLSKKADAKLKEIDIESEKKVSKKVDELFDSFPFVSKLNKATSEHEVVTQETGDKREKKHLREELVTSSAPLNVLDNIKDRIPKK